MPIVLHHLDNSRSQRILWLLEELGAPYEIKNYKRDPATQRAPPELLKVNPLGKAPVITDGDINLAESGAIIEYLIQKYGNGKLAPLETETSKVQDLYFLHYAEGSAMHLFVSKLVYSLAPDQAPWFVRPLVRLVLNGLSTGYLEPEIKKQVDFVESHLSKNEWFAGGSGPTGADFSMAMVIEIFTMYDYGGPAIKEYAKRVKARTAWQKAMEKGGEYKYAAKM
ncbi:glutathione S-transferase [Dendrothele bispora CBS 962.96]|uniref:glutathione transferase n=1 Tax=Dendrothele bispora (strain CBS 962.96) TaxID=1314807 RepID=A0A4S8LIJ0_DENBC|nr:glutathione S-transferase [Dendrothele bispora CBS 962.96]